MTIHDADSARANDHILTRLGWYDVEVEGCELAMEMPTGPTVTNERGGLQGGLLATLADVVAGRLALRGMAPDASVSTSDLHMRFLAPVRVGPARAEGHVVRRGSRTIIVRVDIYDKGADVLAAISTLSFSVMTPLPHKVKAAQLAATGMSRTSA